MKKKDMKVKMVTKNWSKKSEMVELCMELLLQREKQVGLGMAQLTKIINANRITSVNNLRADTTIM